MHTRLSVGWVSPSSETRKVKLPWETCRERNLTGVKAARHPKQPAEADWVWLVFCS